MTPSFPTRLLSHRAAHGAVQLLALTVADLDGIVAVLRGALDLGDDDGAGLDHGDAVDAAVLVEHLRHAQLAAEKPSEWHRPSSTTRSEEHTSELQSLMRNSYAVFCLKKNNQ